ncbi:MAG: hypothetical protein K6G18_15185 [Treponema sp.]|nr:hypothetical protein [Treponema sp.]
MQSAALKDEAMSLISLMPESKIRTVIQFARFISQQPDEGSERRARNERDFALINAHAGALNEESEENLDFQADMWGDE